MKGLIYKDLCQMWRTFKIYLFMAVIFVCAIPFLPDNLIVDACWPSMMTAMTVVGLIGLDEHSHWDDYVCALPCTRAQVVGSKYLLGLMLQLGVTAATAAAFGVSRALHGAPPLAQLFIALALQLLLFCLFCSVELPLLFCFGSEKGRMWMIVGMLAVVGALGGVLGGVLGGGALLLPEGSLPALLAGACAAALALLGASCRLSAALYRRRAAN